MAWAPQDGAPGSGADSRGTTVLNRTLDNSPPAIAELISQMVAFGVHGEVTVGIDVLGGIAALITAMLTSAGFRCVHISCTGPGGQPRPRPSKQSFLKGRGRSTLIPWC